MKGRNPKRRNLMLLMLAFFEEAATTMLIVSKLPRQYRPSWKVLVGAFTYIVMVGGLILSNVMGVRAVGPWIQTDWSGGVGSSSVNQYASGSNIDATTSPGSLKQQETNGWVGSYSNWSRRTNIIITNSGGVQTNYQVRLSITYDSDMQADFDDLRFTNNAGTPLDYWLQSKTDSTSAIVWVEVDSLAASGDTTIYMYYGNSSVTSDSNGSNTFPFFDDFNGASIDSSKWTRVDPRSHISQSGGKLMLTNGGGSGNWDTSIYSTQSFARGDWALEFDMRWTSDYSPYDALMWGWKLDNAGVSYTDLVYGHYNQGDGFCTSNCGSPIYELGSGQGTIYWSNNTNYLVRDRMRASGGNYYDKSTNGGSSFTNDYTSSNNTTGPLRPAFMLYSGDYEVDNLRVHKWLSIEPTASFGTEVTRFGSSASLTSSIFDASVGSDWGTLSYSASTPSGTTISVKVRAGNSSDLSDATAFTACSAVASGVDLTGGCTPDNKRYIQYQVSFTSTGLDTPALTDISIPYSYSDIITPTTNASAAVASKGSGGASILSNGWSNTSPYISWAAGADNVGGSGLKGYCLYVGTDNTADPVTTKGMLGTSPLSTGGACQYAVSGTFVDLAAAGALGTALTSSNTAYYVSIKAIDNGNNVYIGSSAQFYFRFDNTPPTNPAFITAPSQFVASKDVTLTWPTSGGDAAADSNSSVAGLQYRIGNSGTWYGDSHSGSQDGTDLLANDGTYQTQSTPDYGNLSDGNNIIYFRTWDVAGNFSVAYITTAIRINTSSPSSPQNVTATPSTNTTNNFAFNWLAPASFTGSAANLTYCYTINTVPSVSSCTFTAAGVTSLPAGAYATQPGDNTFYVVAKDEAGNINYVTASSTTFTANTAAPGIPLNMDVADISVKATSNWKLTISWESPIDVGAGVANYKVFRSIDNVTFMQIASTSGASYVDTALSQITYYYKVKACDSANNCGAFSSVVSKKPTGKFTSPATLDRAPSVSVGIRSANIGWLTDRNSDSRVAFGLSPGVYLATEASSSDQTKLHSVDLENLKPGTTYYFVAKWGDEDGNLGVSSEYSFTTLPPPTVSSVTTTAINLTQATINFTVSSAVKVNIYYGKSKGFGGLVTLNTSTTESRYAMQIQGLDDGATYFYKVNPVDSEGNEYDQTVFSFDTPPRPRISNLRFQPVVGEPTSTQQITWTTNVPATSILVYGPSGAAKQESTTSSMVTEHEMVVRNLLDDTIYSLIAQSRDAAGNLSSSDEQLFRTALDTRPPKISDFSVETAIVGSGSGAKGQIIVSWKTDEPATSQIAYVEGTGDNYTNLSASDATLVEDHVVIVSDLSTSTAYRVKAVSKDKGGNQGESDSASAIVGKASDNVLSVMFDVVKKLFGR